IAAAGPPRPRQVTGREVDAAWCQQHGSALGGANEAIRAPSMTTKLMVMKVVVMVRSDRTIRDSERLARRRRLMTSMAMTRMIRPTAASSMGTQLYSPAYPTPNRRLLHLELGHAIAVSLRAPPERLPILALVKMT